MADLANARCVVLLTFDFDAESAQIRKTPHLPVAISKGQFAVNVGVPRILETLDRHGIRATFFVPSWTAQRHMDSTREIARRGHEIAAHGYLHENLPELSDDEELAVHEKSIRIIRQVTGSRPIGFRAPYWEWSTRTLNHLRKCGFKYDSSLMNDDKPYLIQGNSARDDMYELPVEWSLDDWTLLETEHQSPESVLNAWRSEFEAVYEMEVGYFMLTMHPECIGRASRIILLERLIREIEKKKGAVFARCDELVAYLSS